MADIRLDKAETALWNEVGSRGEAYRGAIRDRASDQVQTTGKMTEVLDGAGGMLDSIAKDQPGPTTNQQPGLDSSLDAKVNPQP
jgi:hypothetical protein